jgi:hypothetical protein
MQRRITAVAVIRLVRLMRSGDIGATSCTRVARAYPDNVALRGPVSS